MCAGGAEARKRALKEPRSSRVLNHAHARDSHGVSRADCMRSCASTRHGRVIAFETRRVATVASAALLCAHGL